MLVELKCDKFMSRGEIRPPIRFNAGLNTVLGSESGSNFIGKSTFLMIIDFAFGGDDYVLKSTDVQRNVGPHIIKFAFEFGGEKFCFSRDTVEHTYVYKCNDNYDKKERLTNDEFRKFLFEKYDIKLPLINFRDIAGRYFRVNGRDNLDERHPLSAARNEAPEQAITALMKLFNAYAAIHDLEAAFVKSINERDAYRKAQDFHFIPSIGKRQLQKNEKLIAHLRLELAQLQVNSGNELMGLDSQQAEILADLRKKLTTAKRQKSRIISQLNAIENDMSLVSVDYAADTHPIDGNTDSTQARVIQKLQKFFPNVDLKRLTDIEQFHRQLTSILSLEYEEARQHCRDLIEVTSEEINVLEKEIRASGFTPKISRAILEEYAAKKSSITAMERENETVGKMEELKSIAKKIRKRLLDLKEAQIGFLQSAINVKMDEINDIVYKREKRSPVLTINKLNSYTFLTQDDTGTGTSSKGLVVFDLAVMQLVRLPALIHDSVILKQIANEPIERILSLYSNAPGQVFIALDKKGSYTQKTQEVLEQSTVISLSGDRNELFGRSWNHK